MTTKVEKTIQVDAPVSTVYNQWTQFEEFPRFMGGVKQVTQIDDRTLHWVAEIAGVKREWNAAILEQVPDQKIAWAATEGATNAGAVYFEPVGAGQTMVRLTLEHEPEGLVERIGEKLHIIEKRAEADLEKFKSFIESEDYATGAWRGSINEGAGVGTPGVEDAAGSQGDSGKPGSSSTSATGGAATTAAGGAAASGMGGTSSMDSGQTSGASESVDVTGTDSSATGSPDIDVTGERTYATGSTDDESLR